MIYILAFLLLAGVAHSADVVLYSASSAATYPAMVPKTGQTTSYEDYDDGYYESGVAIPDPRFTIQSNTNVVLDNLTGLMWARNANLMGGETNWSDAISFCEALDHGGYTDWRLPSIYEGMTLYEGSWDIGLLKKDDVFNNEGGSWDHYWTSTTRRASTVNAYRMLLASNMALSYEAKTALNFVIPVRGPD